MKIYTGQRISETPGDVNVVVLHKIAECPSCRVEVTQDIEGNYPHFDRTYHMCTTKIDKNKHTRIQEEPLLRRTNVEPTSFDWNDANGIGSVNLAVSILWDVLESRPDKKLASQFAQGVVAKFEHNSWSLNELEIRQWISQRDRRYILAS